MIGLRAAAWVLTLGVRLLAHPVGRRLLAALVLTAVCAGLVALVFTYPESVQPEPEEDTGQATHAGRPRPTTSTKPQAVAPARPAASPEEAAAAWYAHRKHLPRSRVRVLQRDRVNPRLVRVLVMAESEKGRLDTALLSVRRDKSGWRVTQ